MLSRIPVSPKYAKMLLASHKYEGLFIYCVMIVACMSVPEIYNQQQHVDQAIIHSDRDEEEEDQDLVTSIDLQRKQAKERSLKK